jgi:hypothetical protein
MTDETKPPNHSTRPLDHLEWRRVSRRPEMRSIASLQRSIGNRVVARLLERPPVDHAPAPPPPREEGQAASLAAGGEARDARQPRAHTLIPLAVGAAAGALLFARLAAAGEPVAGGVTCILAIAAGLLLGRMLARLP